MEQNQAGLILKVSYEENYRKELVLLLLLLLQLLKQKQRFAHSEMAQLGPGQLISSHADGIPPNES